MTNPLEPLTIKQARKALNTLGGLSRFDHVQSRRSEVDGVAHVEAFTGRMCRTLTIGPRGGLWAEETNLMSQT